MSDPLNDERTPAERALAARLAAHTRWAQHDPIEGTAAARANGPGRIDYWLDQVDPDRTLPEKERLRRAESAKKAYYSRLAYLSAKARREGAARGKGAPKGALTSTTYTTNPATTPEGGGRG